MTTKALRVSILQRNVLVAAVVAALTIAGIPTAHAEFKTGKVCNAQGVCCVLTATGQIADCLYPGSPGMPGNPGQYQNPFPTNAVTVPPPYPIDPATSSPWSYHSSSWSTDGTVCHGAYPRPVCMACPPGAHPDPTINECQPNSMPPVHIPWPPAGGPYNPNPPGAGQSGYRTAIALAPIPTDVPDQNDYLRVAHGWFPGQTDDYLTRLAMSTCQALHPNGPNDHPTQAREHHVAAILTGQMSDMTAANYITLVETDLCP
jgi:hypothetical protein